jgi:hypothetical protein
MNWQTYISRTQPCFIPDVHFEEMAMVNDLPMEYRYDDMELNAYNAAFYDLGLRWHWDRDTYTDLLRRGANAADRIRHYLETRQPHLLRSYDAAFLTDAIEKKAQELKQRRTSPDSICTSYFDWSQAAAAELGI